MMEEEEEDVLFDQAELGGRDGDLSDDQVALLPHDGNKVTNRHVSGRALSCCLKYYSTFCLAAAFFGLGLCIAIPGPTLLDLQQQTNTDTETISRLFTGRSIGYLLGSIVSGFLFDKLNQPCLISLSLLLTAAGTALAPWCRSFYLLVIVVAFQGLSMGFLDTGGNVMCVQIWGEDNGPWMQALHFSFGLGAFVAPLLAEPFLSKYSNTNVTFFAVNDTDEMDIILPNLPQGDTNIQERSVNDILSLSDNFNSESSAFINGKHLQKRDTDQSKVGSDVDHFGVNDMKTVVSKNQGKGSGMSMNDFEMSQESQSHKKVKRRAKPGFRIPAKTNEEILQLLNAWFSRFSLPKKVAPTTGSQKKGAAKDTDKPKQSKPGSDTKTKSKLPGFNIPQNMVPPGRRPRPQNSRVNVPPNFGLDLNVNNERKLGAEEASSENISPNKRPRPASNRGNVPQDFGIKKEADKKGVAHSIDPKKPDDRSRGATSSGGRETRPRPESKGGKVPPNFGVETSKEDSRGSGNAPPQRRPRPRRPMKGNVPSNFGFNFQHKGKRNSEGLVSSSAGIDDDLMNSKSSIVGSGEDEKLNSKNSFSGELIQSKPLHILKSTHGMGSGENVKQKSKGSSSIGSGDLIKAKSSESLDSMELGDNDNGQLTDFDNPNTRIDSNSKSDSQNRTDLLHNFQTDFKNLPIPDSRTDSDNEAVTNNTTDLSNVSDSHNGTDFHSSTHSSTPTYSYSVTTFRSTSDSGKIKRQPRSLTEFDVPRQSPLTRKKRNSDNVKKRNSDNVSLQARRRRGEEAKMGPETTTVSLGESPHTTSNNTGNNTGNNSTPTTTQPSPVRPKVLQPVNTNPDVASGKFLKDKLAQHEDIVVEEEKTTAIIPPTNLKNGSMLNTTTAQPSVNRSHESVTESAVSSTPQIIVTTATKMTTKAMVTKVIASTSLPSVSVTSLPGTTKDVNESDFINSTDPPDVSQNDTGVLNKIKENINDVLFTVEKSMSGLTTVQFAFLIIACYILCVSLLFMFMCCRMGCRLSAIKMSSSLSMKTIKRNETTSFKIQLVLLLFIFFFLYVGMEITVGGLLLTFSVEYLHWSKSAGTLLTSVFWGSFATTRGLSIVFAKCLSPHVMLILDLVLTNLSLVTLLISIDSNPNMLWYCSVVLGMGMASIFPTGISWAERYIDLTSRTTAAFVVGSSLGEMCVPAFTGFMFEQKGPMWLIYIMFGMAVLSIVVYIIMQNLASNSSPVKYSQFPKLHNTTLTELDDADFEMESIPLTPDLHGNESHITGEYFEQNGSVYKSRKKVTFNLKEEAHHENSAITNQARGSILKGKGVAKLS